MGPLTSPTFLYIGLVSLEPTTGIPVQTYKYPPKDSNPTINPSPIETLVLGNSSGVSKAPFIVIVPGFTPPINVPVGRRMAPLIDEIPTPPIYIVLSSTCTSLHHSDFILWTALPILILSFIGIIS